MAKDSEKCLINCFLSLGIFWGRIEKPAAPLCPPKSTNKSLNFLKVVIISTSGIDRQEPRAILSCVDIITEGKAYFWVRRLAIRPIIPGLKEPVIKIILLLTLRKICEHL